MGDRSNVAILQHNADEAVVLYSHWDGEGLYAKVARALDTPEARARWSDDAYLARIVFQYILDLAGFTETGYGISTGLCDNEYQILVLDPTTQRAALRDEASYTGRRVEQGEGLSFEEFALLRSPRILSIGRKG